MVIIYIKWTPLNVSLCRPVQKSIHKENVLHDERHECQWAIEQHNYQE